MKGYSAIQCGSWTNSTITDLSGSSGSFVYFNNPVKLQSVTLTMLDSIPTGETATVNLLRDNVAASNVVMSFTLDDTCEVYDSIVFNLQDYEGTSGNCGNYFWTKVATPTTTASIRCLVTWNYILIESGEPVWNSGSGIKQKRNQIPGDTSVIRDATPFYTRAS
jgi:hypothetical protein